MEGMRSGVFESTGGFNFAPMAARALRDGSRLLRTLRERLPEIPVYLLETPSFAIDEELTMSFIRAGARDKLTAPDGSDFSVFEDTLGEICRQLYLQDVAMRLNGERKVLFFESACGCGCGGSDERCGEARYPFQRCDRCGGCQG